MLLRRLMDTRVKPACDDCASCAPSGRRLPRPLALHRLPADVAAAKAIRPLDAVDRLIGALLRFRDGLACRADIQHAAAIGQNMSVLRYRAGVEDFHALDTCVLVEGLDTGDYCVSSWIAFLR